MTTQLEQELRKRAGLDDVAYDEVSGEQVPPERAPREEDDRPHPSGDDRYAIYSVAADPRDEYGVGRKRIAETSRDGLGTCLVTLRDEGQLTNDSRVGILDRETRQWVVNPWARGDA